MHLCQHQDFCLLPSFLERKERTTQGELPLGWVIWKVLGKGRANIKKASLAEMEWGKERWVCALVWFGAGETKVRKVKVATAKEQKRKGKEKDERWENIWWEFLVVSLQSYLSVDDVQPWGLLTAGLWLLRCLPGISVFVPFVQDKPTEAGNSGFSCHPQGDGVTWLTETQSRTDKQRSWSFLAVLGALTLEWFAFMVAGKVA